MEGGHHGRMERFREEGGDDHLRVMMASGEGKGLQVGM